MDQKGISILGLLLAVMGGSILIWMALSTQKISVSNMKKAILRQSALISNARTIFEIKENIAKAEEIVRFGNGLKVIFHQQINNAGTDEFRRYFVAYYPRKIVASDGTVIDRYLEEVRESLPGQTPPAPRIHREIASFKLCLPGEDCTTFLGLDVDNYLPISQYM